MSEYAQNRSETESTELHRPVLLGRIGRVVIGALQLLFVYSLITNPQIITANRAPEDAGFWILVVLAFGMLSLTLKLGFRIERGKLVAYVALGAALVAAGIDLAVYNRVWAPPLAIVVYAVSIYVHGHMGLCHVLGGLFRVPGCEMRALHYLAARLRGRDTSLIVCPGIWRPIDAWEMRVWKRIAH